MMKNKLELILQKQKEKFMKNLPFLLLFFIIFILLFFQHHLIALYFDDFGNASLSYGQTSSDIIGTNYTFSQLIDWCKMIYMTWGGRILWAPIFLMPFIKTGATVYFALQSIVVTFIIYFIYKIAVHITKERHIFLPIILMILYSLIDMTFLRHGIYWASASILYIWPLLPLFIFIYLYLKLTEKIENKEKVNYFLYTPILLILNFFATFSQEQLGVAMLAFLVLFIIFKHGKDWKQYNKLNIPNLVVCILSFAALMLAPGNYARLETETAFAGLSFMGKIMKNLPSLLLIIFRSQMTIFMIVLTVIFVACLIKYRNELKVKPKITILSNVLFLLGNIICILLQIKFKIVGVFYGLLWILYVGIWMLIYGYQRNKKSIFILALSGCASMFCLVLSPVIGGRTALPFIFYIFLLIIIFTNEFLKESKAYISLIVLILLVPLSIRGMGNYYLVYSGYLSNYNIERLNYDILQKHFGTQKETITLYKSKETSFGVARPYEEPSMEFWLKEYFNIPQETKLEWIDIFEEVRE